MTYQYHATCKCGYRSEVLMGNTCLCPTCRDLVDVPRLAFRYELMPCPNCKNRIFENDMLLELLGKGWLVTEKPSALTCPKCENEKLIFHFDAHLHLAYGIDFPAVGDLIDGCIKRNGKLDIPWFTLDAASVDHDIPNSIERGQRVTMRLTSITTAKPTDTVQSMFYRKVVTHLGLQYINLLPQIRR